MRKIILILLGLFNLIGCVQRSENHSMKEPTLYKEKYRPQFHFSPPTGWMNDPNGLVYNEGVYHLFYQYYPDDIVWGPMHWGHAVSQDMVHWQHKPIALYPDKNGFIFSGSAVVDKNNTSGFGQDGKTPLVAIFTYHLMEGEKVGRNDFQTQGIAYSLDNGETWTKYNGNPVLGNNGIRDLRDPKVFWHEDTKSWVMVLVAGNHVKFYRSSNLKEWSHISDFGQEQGAHGGVWECPDLFPLKVEGSDEEKWVLIVSIGSGGPNGGSATQYFVGDFDGTIFTSDQKEHKWLDWGTDNYAGVTYNNAPDDERIFIGWMSNWQYAVLTPTSSWRSAMTVPRRLSLGKKNDQYMLYGYPLPAVFDLAREITGKQDMVIASQETNTIDFKDFNQSKISFTTENEDFEVAFTNNNAEKFSLIYDKNSKLIIANRTRSGETRFQQEFGNKLHYMDVSLSNDILHIIILIDKSSVELFINKGQYVMTEQVFPVDNYNKMTFRNKSEDSLIISDLSINKMKSIWE